MKLASIIVLNWNGEAYIKDCLNSLKKQTYKNYEIILVDNDSRDNSVNLIKNNFPDAKLIRNKKNKGYAEGNNIGIRASKGDYVILLNMDTVVDKNWLKELIKVAESSDNIGICQSKIYLFDKKDKVNTLGNIIHYLGFGYCGGYLKNNDGINKIKKINYASGASILIKKRVLYDIGLFDESLFLYHEDLDICWRAQLVGYDVVLAPKSIVYHKYNFARNKLKMYYLERNRIMVLLKNYELKTLILIFPAFFITEIGLLFYFLFNGSIIYKIESYHEIIKNFNQILRKRKFIQKNRKINDVILLSTFSGEISFKEISTPILTKIANPLLNFYLNFIRKELL